MNMFLGWQTVYRGSDLECVCENLRPGTQYKVRVACTSSGGVSDFSDICHICTEPVSPGQCAPPRPHGKPKATSLHLKWGKLTHVYCAALQVELSCPILIFVKLLGWPYYSVENNCFNFEVL